MKETPRHIEAFETYYALGDKRSYMALAQRLNVSKTSIAKWSKAHNWLMRATQRDIEIARRLERKTNTAIVNSKADYRKEIRENLKLLKAVLGTALQKVKDEDGNVKTELIISVDSAKNVADIVQAYEKLVKLDLVLIGEADSRTEEVIRVEIED